MMIKREDGYKREENSFRYKTEKLGQKTDETVIAGLNICEIKYTWKQMAANTMIT